MRLYPYLQLAVAWNGRCGHGFERRMGAEACGVIRAQELGIFEHRIDIADAYHLCAVRREGRPQSLCDLGFFRKRPLCLKSGSRRIQRGLCGPPGFRHNSDPAIFLDDTKDIAALCGARFIHRLEPRVPQRTRPNGGIDHAGQAHVCGEVG